jgi:hypothetical protein
MSSGVSGIKWAWVVIGAIVATVVAFLLTLIIQLGYGLVLGFQLRGSPPLIVAQGALRGYPWGLEIWTLLIFAGVSW